MNATISLAILPARLQLYACGEPQLVYLLVRAQTSTAGQTAQPLNVCLVLDRSASMRGERLFQVKQAAGQLVSHLDAGSAFGLVTFNDRAEVVVPAQAVCDQDTIIQAISGIDARGGTEMAQGLAVGLQELERPKLSGISRLILLTDGRTYGDEHACVELARRAQRRGIGLTTLGIGTEWNEDLLEAMSSGPSSRTRYIASDKQISAVFADELTRLQATIAQNAELLIGTYPGAEVRTLHQIEPCISSLPVHHAGNGAWRAALGDWAAGNEQTFLLELALPPLEAGTHPVARIELRCDLLGQPATQASATAGLQLPAVTRPEDTVDHAARRALERVVAFQLQQRAWQAVADGRIDDATRRLQMAGTHLFNAGEVGLAETVHGEATRLLQGGSSSTDGRKRIKYGTRGLVAG